MVLTPGEEKQVDLRPRTGSAHPLLIRVDQVGSRQNLQFTATTANGATMNLGYSAEPRQGEYRVQLPSGSYRVQARSETREESLFGSGQVTVASEEGTSLTLHLAWETTLPVEVAVDRVSEPQKISQGGQSVPAPNAGQFGLFLRNLSGGGDPASQDFPLRAKEDRTFEFRVPPGRYRLSGSGGGWYVESATYGGIVDLLTSNLVIAQGSAGEPIRIVASSARGNLSGQVTLPAGTSTAWVYFLPLMPALAAPTPWPAGSGGSFSASLPVGTYAVVALAKRLQEDLRDAEVVERLTAGAKTVEVTSGCDRGDQARPFGDE